MTKRIKTLNRTKWRIHICIFIRLHFSNIPVIKKNRASAKSAENEFCFVEHRHTNIAGLFWTNWNKFCDKAVFLFIFFINFYVNLKIVLRISRFNGWCTWSFFLATEERLRIPPPSQRIAKIKSNSKVCKYDWCISTQKKDFAYVAENT